MRAVVVGAGVVGLTSALRLRRAGVEVAVWAARRSPSTTSDVAAAIWYPYQAGAGGAVGRWAAETYAELRRLAAAGAPGVRLRMGTELFRTTTPDPWWRDAVPELTRPARGSLPAGYLDGHRFAAPVLDMSVHLPALEGTLETLGTGIERRRVTDLAEPLAAADVVVNCTGLGARELVPDPGLTPVRGQVLRLGPVGVDEWLVDDSDGLTYVVPRDRDVVCGGSADPGREDVEVDPAESAEILARCVALEPRLAAAPVLGAAVGLRPVRPQVRVERVGAVVHNYGHGGAGVTLAWGCAGEVVRLVTGAPARPRAARTGPPQIGIAMNGEE